ncbi:MAG TPA: hypothetical protein VIV12_04305 [Streptosporangiaceae bacterium]
MKPELGEVVMTQHYDRETGAYSVTVDHADPRVLVSSHLLAMLTTPDSGDFPAWQRNATLEPGNGPGLYGGCVLRVHAANRTLVYRIVERHDEHAWIGEWPD